MQQTFGDAESRPQASVAIYDLRTVLRMMFSGDLGLAEGYMEGEWNTGDLTSLLMLGSHNMDALSGAVSTSWTAKALNRIHHSRRANTREGSRRNIAAHYDLGNEFFSAFLDRTLTYSCGIFNSPDETLEKAQINKYNKLINLVKPKDGDKILEIGCGWGGFAEHLAKNYNVKIDCITISKKQFLFAKERIRRS